MVARCYEMVQDVQASSFTVCSLLVLCLFHMYFFVLDYTRFIFQSRWFSTLIQFLYYIRHKCIIFLFDVSFQFGIYCSYYSDYLLLSQIYVEKMRISTCRQRYVMRQKKKNVVLFANIFVIRSSEYTKVVFWNYFCPELKIWGIYHKNKNR